jgi:hypothetical protein
VEVTARRQDSPPKFTEIRYRLQVTTDEPDRRVELAHRNLRNYVSGRPPPCCPSAGAAWSG